MTVSEAIEKLQKLNPDARLCAAFSPTRNDMQDVTAIEPITEEEDPHGGIWKDYVEVS